VVKKALVKKPGFLQSSVAKNDDRVKKPDFSQSSEKGKNVA
jgi:hypothetical protein